jgi:isoleucyl-tRNA synthetase
MRYNVNHFMFKPISPQVNFPELEKQVLQQWKEKDIVQKYIQKNKNSKKRYSFLDGPITANNPMGVHHAWGRTFKDIWQRYFNMNGYAGRFQNGFDCQGLWVEVEVEKELGIRNKRDIENLVPGDKKASIAKFVDLCKQRVLKYSAQQALQSQRLGYFMDWDHSYYTMSDENNYMIWHFLKVCFENGWIYKGTESVPWCPRCETAISQHEMLTEDYKEITHKSIYMRFPIVGRNREYVLVWTTTPWTIPANSAVAVDKTFDYVQVQDEKGDSYWLGSDAADRLFGPAKKIVKTEKGMKLVGWKYKGAFDDLPNVKKVSANEKFHTVIPTDPLLMPITTTEGTGMVHTAVSAGEEDFKLGKKLGLPMIPVIADNADYLEGLGEFSGKNAKKHPELILDFMTEHGFAWKIEQYTHRYPACWRCKTELVWKVENEWYIAMDVRPLKIQNPKSKIQKYGKDTKTLRQRMMGVAKKIKWIPQFGLERELDWLKNMHDWLISKKNRYWGLALPIFECKDCKWFTVIGSKEELQEKAVSGWNEFEGHSPHKPYIDEVKIKCGKCGKIISRLNDVGNVWLDAGIVPFSTLVDPQTKKLSYTSDKKYWKEWFPADFITESFPGQFKNWFYSMIAMASALEDTNPFKTVLGYASMLGEDGRPMHKSWGNSIEFNEGADKIGVDVMRWTFVTHNPTENLLFGYKKTDETRRKFHLMLWHIYNFFLTNAAVDNWKPDTKQNSTNKNILDEWIRQRLNEVISKVSNSMNSYDAYTASSSIGDFVNDLSLWYIRRSRDRVGPSVQNCSDKTDMFQTLHTVLCILSRLLAPFQPFLSEIIYTNVTDEPSVHLSTWPEKDAELGKMNAELIKEMEYVRMICELGHAKRKELGIKVRQPLGKIQISNSCLAGGQAKFQMKNELLELIKDELNVKEVEIKKGKGELKVEFDTVITDDLREEGQARDIIRLIQQKRKEMGCSLVDTIETTLPDWPKKYTDMIKKVTLSSEIHKGEHIQIEIKK